MAKTIWNISFQLTEDGMGTRPLTKKELIELVRDMGSTYGLKVSKVKIEKVSK